MEKKTTAKLDEAKAAVKTAAAKTTAKAEEIKAAVKETVEEKKAAPKVTAASKEKETVAEIKKDVTEAKETITEKKAVKPAVKKVVEKEDLKPEIFIQFQGNEAMVAEVIEKAKGQFIADGHRASSIKSLQVYLKPEELMAYYVINQKFAGKVDMF